MLDAELDGEGAGQQFKEAMGSSSMELMDIMDDDLAAMVTLFHRQAELMARELGERGCDEPTIVQLVTSFAAAAAASVVC